MKRHEVKTRRLVLRPLRASDYQSWFDGYVKRLPAQNKWDSGPCLPKQCTRAIFRKIMQRHNTLAKEDDYYWYGVLEKKSGHLIGHIDFNVFLRSTHQFANFGYQIFNRYWGNGFGGECTAAGLRIGFKQLKLNRLEASINLGNKRSIRLARSIGMRREGIKRRYWYEDGKWTDQVIYVANPEDIGLAPIKPF